MPQMGVSVAEGTIVKWHKHPGDWVEADETVCEISTDKIDTELPSPASGRLVRILAEENATVAVGTVLAEIDTDAQPRPGRMRPRRTAGTAVARGPVARDLAGGAARRGRARHRPVAGEGHRASAAASARRTYLHSLRRASRASDPCTPSPRIGRSPSGHRRTANCEPRTRTPLSPMRKPDRRAHDPQPPHGGTRDHRRRGRHVSAWSRGARELKEPFGARGVPLTYLAFVARATVGGAPGAPGPERLHRRRGPGAPRRREPRHRGRARGRADRAGDPEGAAPQPRGPCGRDRRPRRPRPREAPDRRGRAGRHLHDHEPGPVRHRPCDADREPAPGRDPGPGGDREAAGGGRGPTPATRSRSGRWSTCACRSTTGRSTAPMQLASWVP